MALYCPCLIFRGGFANERVVEIGNFIRLIPCDYLRIELNQPFNVLHDALDSMKGINGFVECVRVKEGVVEVPSGDWINVEESKIIEHAT